MRLSVSLPLVEGDRVGTMLVGLQSVGHVVQVCLEGCYVCKNTVEGSVEPCLVEFFRECCDSTRQNGRKMTSFRGCTAKLAAWVGCELGGSAPHQCR